jgi:hypothetical protein
MNDSKDNFDRFTEGGLGAGLAGSLGYAGASGIAKVLKTNPELIKKIALALAGGGAIAGTGGTIGGLGSDIYNQVKG